MSGEVIDLPFRYRRLVRMVERYVGNRQLAIRYVRYAKSGERPYTRVVREAFDRRHSYTRAGSHA